MFGLVSFVMRTIVGGKWHLLCRCNYGLLRLCNAAVHPDTRTPEKLRSILPSSLPFVQTTLTTHKIHYSQSHSQSLFSLGFESFEQGFRIYL